MLNQLYSFYEGLKQDSVIFCFSGPASQSVVEGVGQALKRKMEFEEAGMPTVQRIFSIFVEQMQNIIHYSIERTPSGNSPDSHTHDLRHGVVMVGQENGEFYVICGNKVHASQSGRMIRRIEHLKTLTKQELKAHYKEVRRREPEGDSRGAGLGFIEMFRRACAPLEYKIVPIDDETVFFSIKARG